MPIAPDCLFSARPYAITMRDLSPEYFPPIWEKSIQQQKWTAGQQGTAYADFVQNRQNDGVNEMENENCEMLFEYLRSILYDTKIKRPELEKLDEPYQKLGQGLEFLQKAVEEMLAYSADLSK